MGWFSTKKERTDLKKIEEMTILNAEAIHRVENEHLERIKKRQQDIERRLQILKQEAAVQQRDTK
jgi:hypothetical protein